jgi:L-fuconolactonase
MAGSDWPVCLLASSYARWFETLAKLVKPLSATERELILGGVATEVYELEEVSKATVRSEGVR